MFNAGDITLEQTVYIIFNTFDSNGSSVTVTDLVAGDVHIHKDGGLTQRSSSAGITVSIDFDGITGCHLIAIDTSDNTDSGFYSSGSDYKVRLEGITVDSQTLNPWVGLFSIENRFLNPAPISGSSGISTVATTAVITTGSETLTYTATHERDGTEHQISDAAGTTDMYYELNVGSVGVPSSITLYGRSNGGNDDINVYGYNWGTTTWEQIGTITGKVQSTNDELTFSMYSTHVGTGVNAGKVRVRFYNTGLTTANLYIDQLYVSYAIVQSPVGYSNGMIWVDTINGTSGAVVGVNGVADLPVDNWADALTLSTATGLTNFNIAGGSSITLTANSDYFSLYGETWTLALGGQSITGAYFHGAVISGIGTNGGAAPTFEHCTMGICTLPVSILRVCGIGNTITIGEAGTYYFESCYSGVAGTGTPVLDFGSGIGSTNINFRHYSGGIEIQNMGQTGTDTMSLEGHGQYVINANCAGGTLAIRGHFKKTDNSGNVTISDDANFKNNVVTFGMAQSSTANTIVLASTASALDGAYDPCMIFIVTGTGAGQSRLGLEYFGATKTLVVDRDWKVNPDTTSEYRIIAHPGREHVNEGLAQGGTVNTITLNPLASSVDNAFIHQTVFLRSGTGQDQSNLIIAYDGTTKIATCEHNWAISPDTTTGYVILGTHIPATSEIQSSCDAAITANTDINNIEVDTGTTIPGLIAALENISTTDVNAEVVDAIYTDTYDEPSQGAPPSVASLVNKINYIYKFLINLIENDGTFVKVYDKTGATVDHKATVSESGSLVTREKFITGP